MYFWPNIDIHVVNFKIHKWFWIILIYWIHWIRYLTKRLVNTFNFVITFERNNFFPNLTKLSDFVKNNVEFKHKKYPSRSKYKQHRSLNQHIYLFDVSVTSSCECSLIWFVAHLFIFLLCFSLHYQCRDLYETKIYCIAQKYLNLSTCVLNTGMVRV